jgi:hypothetical protein
MFALLTSRVATEMDPSGASVTIAVKVYRLPAPEAPHLGGPRPYG